MKALDAVRRHPWRTFVALWIISALVVVAFVPSRMKGTRDGSSAFVPLRFATAEELADLLVDARTRNDPHTGVVAIDGNAVTVHTWVYLLDEPEKSSSECSWSQPGREAGKRPLCSATWHDYVIRHRVARDALEKSLGHEIHVQDLDVALAGKTVTHDPRWLPIYVVVESITIALILAAMLLTVARLGFGALLPVLFLCCLSLYFGIQEYSPALSHVDDFHQRIVIEYLIWPTFVLILPLGLALLISVTVKLVRRRLSRRRAEVDAA